MARYWLDASVFIYASRNLYAFDINESFWLWLDDQILEGRVVSAKRVFIEVTGSLLHRDALCRWVKSRKGNGLCIQVDENVQDAATEIVDHIYSGRYPQEEAWKFSNGADAWVIAHAMAEGGIVVTNESSRHPDAKKVRIPDVCFHFGIQCIDLLQLMRDLQAKL